MKVYGHPWSINSRKVLMTLAEKGHTAALELVMIPTGEHKRPAYLAVHPFGKVPALADGDFVLYETEAIQRYLDRVVDGPALVPADAQAAARVAQWLSVSDSYFAPYAQRFIVESLFRQYLGGAPDTAAIEAARTGMLPALDALDQHLDGRDFIAGSAFSIADIHWMPYLEYLVQTGHAHYVTDRPNLTAWWQRVSTRRSWQQVARTGPQPYDQGMTADVIEKLYR